MAEDNAGRPTKYKSEYNSTVLEYLKTRKDNILPNGNITVKLPTIKDFAIYINVNESTLYEWKGKHKRFSKSLDKIKAEQEKRLLDNGLQGSYNSTIAKLILSSNHGYSDKAQVDTNITGLNLTELFNNSKE